MAVHELDPISRIEGHLGAKLTTAGAAITDVEVHGNLWRGFENFLIGREPNDAITFTQRICGVCPVPHGQASTWAVEAAIGYSGTHQFQTGMGEIPTKAIHIRNMVLGAEYLMSSLTHFYHLAAPSYVQGPAVPPWTPYFDDAYYSPLLLASAGGTNGGLAIPNYATSSVLPVDEGTRGFSADLWSAVIKQYVKALRIRRLTFEAGAMFAGRMPMTSCYVAGGVTTYKADSAMATKCTKFTSFMTEIGDFVIREYIPIVLALGALYPNFDNEHNGGQGWGAGCGNFLAWGGFPYAGVAMDANGVTGNHFPRGWVKNAGGYFGAAQTQGTIDAAAVQTDLIEHVAYSRYQQNNAYGYDANGLSYPYQASRTVPERLKGGAYSYLKAPRWAGDPMEVGPLARLVVMNQYKVDMASPEFLIGDGVGDSTLQTVAALYTKTHVDLPTVTGLDPKMVHQDLAVACVRADAAAVLLKIDMSTLIPAAPAGNLVWKVVSGSGANFVAPAGTVADPKIIGIDNALITTAIIVAAYQAANAIIVDGGTISLVTWIATMQLGLSTMDRLRARALESAFIMIWMMGMPSKPALAAQAITWANNGWVSQLAAAAGDTYTYIATPADGLSHTGIGGTEAPRGALMHICTIGGDGKIERYQCIVPTTWNASPRDFSDVMGPMEQAIVAPGTGAGFPAQSAVAYAADGGVLYPPVSGGGPTTTEGGVEALRIAQSFDPCIACAVH